MKRKADWALNWIGNKNAAYGDVPDCELTPVCCVLVAAKLISFCCLVQASVW